MPWIKITLKPLPLKVVCENEMSKRDQKLCCEGNIWPISLKHKLRLNMTSSCDNVVYMFTQEIACGSLVMKNKFIMFFHFWYSLWQCYLSSLQFYKGHMTARNITTRDEAQHRNQWNSPVCSFWASSFMCGSTRTVKSCRAQSAPFQNTNLKCWCWPCRIVETNVACITRPWWGRQIKWW